MSSKSCLFARPQGWLCACTDEGKPENNQTTAITKIFIFTFNLLSTFVPIYFKRQAVFFNDGVTPLAERPSILIIFGFNRKDRVYSRLAKKLKFGKICPSDDGSFCL